ncbi:MAG: 2-oxoacid:acceptor oxidoreductase subunit alpha [Thermoleophilia bacterium]|nr:2-oxoacid:acceptor oxidoreductase subunit alpha [Thermoleophilia bacterium]
MSKAVEERDRVVIRFAGDSGDGMQLTGDRFTSATGLFGNDLVTLPDFPAEIRAPRGTLHGVSAFQIQFASRDILTPGDEPSVLVAMNPAALKANIGLLEAGGAVIVNEDEFTARNLERAGYAANPLEDGSLTGYQVYRIPMETLTLGATEGIAGLSKRQAERAKNFFALGLVSWMYGRPIDVTERWITETFASQTEIRDANLAAFRAGWNFGETTEVFAVRYEVKPAPAAPGTYRNVSGAAALAWGLIAASVRSGLPLFYASYPITPASEILHELSRRKNFDVRTLQAEDEIAAANLALGASFGGHLGVTGTSGPGMDLKAETIGLAVMLELPLVIVDVQRAGPSTGLPTKNEASDLLMALYGRHGEAPVPIVAAYAAAQCFDAAIEAARIAIVYRTPVILLSDTFLGNSSEPWLVPSVDDLPAIDPAFTTAPNSSEGFLPYLRDERLARPWVVPGTPGLEHRIGGLEKQDRTGAVSYDPENHELMTSLRAAKVAGIAREIPPLHVDDPDGADLLVLGWGSTYGAIRAAARLVRGRGGAVATAHFTHLNPLPANTGEVLASYERILVPELNSGQLARVLRAEYLMPAESYTKLQGQPFAFAELEREMERRL